MKISDFTYTYTLLHVTKNLNFKSVIHQKPRQFVLISFIHTFAFVVTIYSQTIMVILGG
jgi:hypothetical protein